MLFLLILGAVIARRVTVVKRNNLPFLLNHFGLWLALAAGFFGQADNYTLQTKTVKGYMISQAFTSEGQKMDIPFDIELKNIQSKYDVSGEPKSFTAQIIIKKEEVYKIKEVSVNRPYQYKGYDIYLLKAGNNICTLQIVYDPWRYIVLFGIVLMIIGSITLFFTGFKHIKKDDRVE
jgi:cytochrome c biogenesis protein ResB